MIKLVIFDMAGTAVSEDNIVYKTIVSAINSAGHTVSLEQVLEHGAGKEKQQAIADIFDSMNVEICDDEIDRIHTDFRARLDAAYLDADLRLFDSVMEVIEELQQRDIAIAFNTGYKRPMAMRILDKCGIAVGRDIDALAAADDVERGRPHPDMILQICSDLQIDPSRAIKIGDSAIDIHEGQNAKVAFTVGVTTGAQTREQIDLAAPDFIIDDMLELLSLIEAHG